MKRNFLRSVQGRAMAILIFFMTVTLAGSFLVVRNFSQNIMSSEKANKLQLVAALLDFQLGDRDYDSILREQGMENASREEKIAALNVTLSAFGDVMTARYPDMGVGYYSLELDAILTYAPSELYASTIGVAIGADHPGRIVMQNNEAMVRTGTMVRGNIMNAMQPIARNGKVIGYAWANELTSGIETEYRKTSNSILIIMLIIYIVSVGMAVVMSKRSMRDIHNIVKGVRLLRSDMSQTLPKASGDLGEVVDNINAMAADVLEAEESKKALLLAEASNVAQRDFLSRMSHEIRTPMNGVLGMTHLAQNATSEEQRMEYLGKIHASASLLLGIINDILDISKIEAGKMKIEEQPFKILDTVDNIRDLMTPLVDEKNLEFIIDVDASVPAFVVGDSLRVSQMLFNIVGNAVKFTLDGYVKLSVSAVAMPEDKIDLRFSVMDTGIGMSEEQLQNVFKSFAQADSSTARKFGGSGLGLSISLALVELMGGKISATSAQQKGSEFVFNVIVGSYSGGGEVLDNDDFGETPQNYDGYELLVVEDNEINQEIAKAVLEGMGFAVDIANNGKEAVEAFCAKKYDLIFMDIRMPIMDGIEATREIRAIERQGVEAGTGYYSHVPIVAMTANAMKEDMDATQEVGMDRHISKPIIIEEINRVLHEQLRK